MKKNFTTVDPPWKKSFGSPCKKFSHAYGYNTKLQNQYFLSFAHLAEADQREVAWWPEK